MSGVPITNNPNSSDVKIIGELRIFALGQPKKQFAAKHKTTHPFFDIMSAPESIAADIAEIYAVKEDPADDGQI